MYMRATRKIALLSAVCVVALGASASSAFATIQFLGNYGAGFAPVPASTTSGFGEEFLTQNTANAATNGKIALTVPGLTNSCDVKAMGYVTKNSTAAGLAANIPGHVISNC